MKVTKLLLVLCVLCCHLLETYCAPSPPFKPSPRLPGPLDSSDQLAIAYLEKEAAREKRGSASGSGDILKHIKTSIGQGIKNKITQIAKSSAGASAYFSKSSSAHHHGPPEHGHYPHYPPPHYYPAHGHGYQHHDEKPFDIFEMKKSVLYTLLQAAKAIKGGVIAIKGQLLKGGGHLLTAKGKLIRGGGEALSSLGKNIALSAFHLIPESHEDDEEIIHEAPAAEEHPSTGYGYSGPSAGGHDIPHPSYGHPTGGGYYHNSVYDGKATQQHDGLIILRKIPKNLRHPGDSDGDHTNDEHHQQHHEQHDQHEEQPPPEHHHHHAYVQHDPEQQDVQESQKTPAFRPLSDGIVPKMKNLVSSVFQSSAYPVRQYDNAPSHSNYNSQYNNQLKAQHQTGNVNVKQKVVAANTQVQPEQASVGSLVNYLQYIRNAQKGKGGAKSENPKAEKVKPDKTKAAVYVTPAPTTSEKGNHNGNEQSANSPQQSQQALKQETALLEQQLQQLASLQSLQHQLQLLNPYAADLVAQQVQHDQQVAPSQGQVQGQNQLFAQQQVLVPAQNPIQYNPGELDAQNYPVVFDIPGNVGGMLTQYEFVPEHIAPQPTAQPHTPQIQQIPQLQYQLGAEDPMVVAESINIPTFLIQVPDEDEIVEGRSLKTTARAKPKPKRHLRLQLHQAQPIQTPHSVNKKKLSQLQQVQLMQQQLYHPQQQNNKKQTKRSPTIDVVRSISFEIGPGGLVKTNP